MSHSVKRSGPGKDHRNARFVALLFVILLGSIVLMGFIGGPAGADAVAATVQEKEDMEYDIKLDPGGKAKFKWDILNPTNVTWNISVQVMSDNPDFTGKVDKTSFQVFAGQSDTIKLTVEVDADESDEAKFTLVFTLTNAETGEELTAYKTATVNLVITHGVDFHGYFTLKPSWLGLDDNDWTRLLLIILFYLGLACLTLLILNPGIRWAVRKTKTEIDDIILNIISKPVFVLVILYGLLDAVALMEFIPKDLATVLDTFFGLAVLFIILYLAFKLFKGVVVQFGKEFAAKTETEIDDVLIPVIEKLGVVFIGVFGLMGILSYFGINLTMAAAGFGVFGLVIAFAAQSSIANFFGGIFIMLDRPFKVDDLILINDDYCKVNSIGIRTTRVYDIFDHAIIIMPNDKLANSTVVNLSAPDLAFKAKVLMEVEYGTDPDKFVEVMKDIVRTAPDDVGIIKDDPDRGLWGRLNALKDSSMEFVVGFWVDDIMKQWSAAGYVRTKLYYYCVEKGINIPFPQMDVHIIEKKQA